MEELLPALDLLHIHRVPQEWVDAVWDSEFTGTTALDETTETQLTSRGPKALVSLYKSLLAYAASPQQSLWAVFGENRVPVKNLLAVLSFFVLAGKNKMANLQERMNGLYSASVYLVLLGLPGSIAYQVFHEVLMDTCSNLTSHCWPYDSGKKRKKDVLKSSLAEGKRARHQQKDTETQAEDQEDEESEAELFFSGADLMELREAVVVLVQSLLRLLQTFPLKDRQASSSSCTQIFTKLLYLEPVSGTLDFHPPRDVGELRSIPEMSFYGLQLLCSTKHGDPNESLRRVFQRLLLVIMMMSKGNQGRPSLLVPTHANLAVRDHALSFVCHLVDTLKEQARPLLNILLQQICFQMVEKSEYRSHGAQAVGMLASRLESTDYCGFTRWLLKLSKQAKMVHRLFSVDVVMVLLKQPERDPEESMKPELAAFLQHKFLIQKILFVRRMDGSPTVQGHALSCLSQCLELPSFNATQAVHHLFSATETQTVLEQDTTGGTISSQKTQKIYRSLPFRTVDISSPDTSALDAKENLALLLKQVKASKMNVRKSALQALVGLLKHEVIPLSDDNLGTLSERCRDPAVSVKKKALQCVGELLAAKPEDTLVQRAWLNGVVPAVMDAESTVQDKALEALDAVLLRQVKPLDPSGHLDAAQRLSWDLLGLLCRECHNLSRYFSRAFTIWTNQNKFTKTFIVNLISHTEADHAAGAWLLLSKVVTLAPKLPYDKILEAWDVMISSEDINVTTCCHILSVVGDSAVNLNDDTKNRLIEDVMSWLKTFRLPLEVISAAVAALYQLGCSSEHIKQTQAFLNLRCGELVSLSEAYLAGVILSENGCQDLNEELMVKHLHTLGVASLHCPAKVSKRTVLLVESILTTHSEQLAGSQEEIPASLPMSQFKPNFMPTRVRAHGVITLGKLCLQHEELVQKYLPVFARELEVGTEVAVRNNVVVVVCDLCVRYTNSVYHYIPNISACLRDCEPVIREQTLIMLTNLLQEEFVKWKGSLFFRYMVALVDPLPAIASLCEYCLIHLLLKKNPEMFSQHFIECIFHFNSYTKHKIYNKFPQNQRDEGRFSLKGDVHRERRFRIYRFLLEHFTDAQRFNTSNKINQSVLACFADEELPLDDDGMGILSETFNILSLKEMKLQAICAPAGGAAGDEPDEENMATMAKAVMQVAQRKVVSQVQKKAFIENTVPLIISLKALLEKRRCPVLKDLMAYLQTVMTEYRSEVKECFAGDEQLAAEVEFALKKAEEETTLQALMSSFGLSTDASGPSGQAPGRPPPLRPPRVSATPQAPRPHTQPSRAALTDPRASKLPHVGSSSVVSKFLSLEATGAATDRAISTPKGVNIELTFDEGLSAVFSDHGTSAEETSALRERSNTNQCPAVRQWNVQSPLRAAKPSSRLVR